MFKHNTFLRRFTSATLIAVLLVGILPVTVFASTASTWAFGDITRAIELGIVPQVLQGNYTQQITRAEFTTLAVALYEKQHSEITGRITFSDTSDVNVQKAAYLGIVFGVGDDLFGPTAQLTREQAAVMLVRLAEAIGQQLSSAAPTFADNSDISPWAVDAVGQIQAAELMSGVGNNLFAPQNPYTREQSIITILRLFDAKQTSSPLVVFNAPVPVGMLISAYTSSPAPFKHDISDEELNFVFPYGNLISSATAFYGDCRTLVGISAYAMFSCNNQPSIARIQMGRNRVHYSFIQYIFNENDEQNMVVSYVHGVPVRFLMFQEPPPHEDPQSIEPEVMSGKIVRNIPFDNIQVDNRELSADSRMYFQADFTLGDIVYRVTLHSNLENGEAQMIEIVNGLVLSGTEGFETLFHPVVLDWRSDALTLEEILMKVLTTDVSAEEVRHMFEPMSP